MANLQYLNINVNRRLKEMVLFSSKIYAAAVSVALLLTIALAGVSFATKPVKAVVARVNGVEITMEEVETAVNNMMPLTSFHSSVSERRLKAMQKKALDQLIDSVLIYNAARKDDISASNKEIDQEIETLKKRLPEGETLEKVLERSQMSIKELRDELRRAIVVNKMNQMMNEQLKKETEELVNEKFVHNYYNNNMDKFMLPEKIHLRSILIKADPSGGQRVWTAARKRAQEIADKARKGEDFSELAKKHSEDVNALKGGDMGWAHKGSLFDEIDSAAAMLKKGEISDPVMTIYGYHVLKLEGRKPAVQLKYSEIDREKLKTELLNKEFRRMNSEWKASLRSKAKVEYLGDIK